jgi:hypothetical protein
VALHLEMPEDEVNSLNPKFYFERPEGFSRTLFSDNYMVSEFNYEPNVEKFWKCVMQKPISSRKTTTDEERLKEAIAPNKIRKEAAHAFIKTGISLTLFNFEEHNVSSILIAHDDIVIGFHDSKVYKVSWKHQAGSYYIRNGPDLEDFLKRNPP